MGFWDFASLGFLLTIGSIIVPVSWAVLIVLGWKMIKTASFDAFIESGRDYEYGE